LMGVGAAIAYSRPARAEADVRYHSAFMAQATGGWHPTARFGPSGSQMAKLRAKASRAAAALDE